MLKRNLTTEIIWNVFAPFLLPLKRNLLHLPQVILKNKNILIIRSERSGAHTVERGRFLRVLDEMYLGQNL